MMAVTKDRIFGLDIIRCLAIVFVLLSHTEFILPLSEGNADFVLLYLGFTGVELFFVLSGYLVGKILLELFQKRSVSFATIKYFWIRRWFRTLPAYYLILLIYAGLYYWTTGKFIFADSFHLLYFVFLQNFFTGPPVFFRDAWSLSVEEWFYLVLPLSLLFVHRFIKKLSVLNVIILGIVVFTLFRIIAVLLFDLNWNLGVRAVVPLRLDSLLVGVLLGYLHLHFSDKWTKYAKPCFIAGLLMLVPLSVWMYLDVILTHKVSQFLTKTIFFNLFSIAIALCMPYMASIKTAPGRLIGLVVTHISLISYSLYLIHKIVIHLFLTGYYISAYKLNLPYITVLKYIGAWAACIVMATIMYRFYEKPFMNLRERFKLKKVKLGSSNPS